MSKKPNISIQFEEEAKLFPQALVQKRFNKYSTHYNTYNIIGEEVSQRLVERLTDFKRTFIQVLDLGAGTGTTANHVKTYNNKAHIFTVDIAKDMLLKSKHMKVLANAEEQLPFADETFDLVISNMALPYINDIPKFLHMAGKCLQKDGVFLASTLGLESFPEFRESFEKAGLNGNHLLPLPDVRSVGSALQRRGYALPVIDRDILNISFPSLESIYEELTHLAARNINPKRLKGLTGKTKWQKMEQHYKENFKRKDGSLQLTLEIIYMHGFRPHENQPKPLKPGSAKKSMHKALNKT